MTIEFILGIAAISIISAACGFLLGLTWVNWLLRKEIKLPGKRLEASQNEN